MRLECSGCGRQYDSLWPGMTHEMHQQPSQAAPRECCQCLRLRSCSSVSAHLELALASSHHLSGGSTSQSWCLCFLFVCWCQFVNRPGLNHYSISLLGLFTLKSGGCHVQSGNLAVSEICMTVATVSVIVHLNCCSLTSSPMACSSFVLISVSPKN